MGERVDPRFRRARAAWLASLTSDNTRAAYGRDLEVYEAWLVLVSRHDGEVTAEEFEDFLEHCTASGASPTTVNRRLAAVSSFYRHVTPTWKSIDPTQGSRRAETGPRRPADGLTVAQERAVWAAAERVGGKSAVLVALVLYDGLKSKDLLRLDIEHLHVHEHGVAIKAPEVVGVQVADLDHRTALVIRSHIGGRRSGPLLMGENPTRDADRLTRFGVDYLIKKIGRQAGLEVPLTVNTLRATRLPR